MDLSHWGAAEWGAFGQVGALVVAVVAGLLVWLQVLQGRQVREEQTFREPASGPVDDGRRMYQAGCVSMFDVRY